MNLFSYSAHFGTEEDCRNHFKSERDKIGLTCKCGSTEHFWIKSRLSYECKICRSRTSLKSGTIMENSNLSFSVASNGKEDCPVACAINFRLSFVMVIFNGKSALEYSPK